MKWKHRRLEERRRQAMERQLAYNDTIDAGFQGCATLEKRESFVSRLKPMQKARITQKFKALLGDNTAQPVEPVVAKKQPSGRVELSLDDNIVTAIEKFSKGIPGAVMALAQMNAVIKQIDPFAQNLGIYMFLMQLESCQIYGPRLWDLYDSVCSRKANWAIGLMRATQLGIVTHKVVNDAIDNRQTVNMSEILKEVCARIPGYNPEAK